MARPSTASAVASLPTPPATRRRSPSCWQWCHERCRGGPLKNGPFAGFPNFFGPARLTLSDLILVLCWAGLPVNVRLCFGQPCSPLRNGRFARPCDRSAYTYTPSGRSPARLVSFSRVPPGCRPKTKPRVAPLVEFGAVLGGSASLPLPAPPLPSSSRRYAPQCFVAGIPSPRLATCLTAHPTNRVIACRSVRHSPPRPLPHLP